MTTRLPSRPAAWIRRLLCGSSYLCSFRLSLAFSISLQSGTSRRPRLVGPCTDLARGDQSPPSAGGTVHRPCTGGPVAALGWWDRAPTLHGGTSRCPRLAVRASTAHGSRPRPHISEAQPSFSRRPALPPEHVAPRAKSPREHAAPRARRSVGTLRRELAASRAFIPRACCLVNMRLRDVLLREHAAPRTRCCSSTLARGRVGQTHAAPRVRSSTC